MQKHRPSTNVQATVSSELDHTAYRPPTTAAKLPEITSEMTHAQFRKVETDWDVYKKLTRLPVSQIGPLLYSACDDTVQNVHLLSCYHDANELILAQN